MQKLKPVFELKDIEAQLSPSEIEAIKGSIAAATTYPPRMVRHKQGTLDLIALPSGKLMFGSFLDKEKDAVVEEILDRLGD